MENPASQKSGKNKHTGAARVCVNDTSNHELIINDFIESIESGRDPLITGESARDTTELILEIYKNQF